MSEFERRICMNCRHFDEVNPYTLITCWCYKHKERVNPLLPACGVWDLAIPSGMLTVGKTSVLVIGNSSRRFV